MNYIGKWLQVIRKKQHITKENLSEGICSISFLTKIEQGERYANKLIMDALFSRLGLQRDSYILFLPKQEYFFIRMKAQIQTLLMRQDYLKAEQVLNWYCGAKDEIDSIHKQQILIFKAQISKEKKTSYCKQMEIVLQALSITIKDVTQESWSVLNLKKGKRYSLSELYLFTQYAFLLNEVKETTKALILYSSILTYQESVFTLDKSFIELYMNTAYTAAKILYHSRDYDSAAKFCLRTFIQASKYNIPSFFYIRLIDLYESFYIKQGQVTFTEEYLKSTEPFRKNESHFKNIKKDYNVSIYPLHKVIRFRRNNLHISQEKIADGICALSTISRIECGVSKPNHKIEEQLLLRLGLPMNYCGLPSSFYEKDIQLARTMIQCYLLGNYFNAMSLFQTLKHNLNSIRPENQYFFMCWETLINFWL